MPACAACRARRMDLMKGSALAVLALLSLASSACVTPRRGDTAAQVARALPTSGEQVAFDHPGCPAERIRLIRSGPDSPMAIHHTTLDWYVCGVVRRYKAFGGGMHSA